MKVKPPAARSCYSAPDYFVSELGTVYNSDTLKEIKPCLRNGYETVNLRVSGVGKNFYVHRLVAEAFIPNPDDLPVVNHKDRDRTNNRVSNLEWCSVAHNQEHSSAKTYLLCTPEGEKLEVFNLKKFCKGVGLSYGAMTFVVTKRQRRHKGWSLWED